MNREQAIQKWPTNGWKGLGLSALIGVCLVLPSLASAEEMWSACIANQDDRDRRVSVEWQSGSSGQNKEECSWRGILEGNQERRFECSSMRTEPRVVFTVYGREGDVNARVYGEVSHLPKMGRPCGNSNTVTIVAGTHGHRVIKGKGEGNRERW